MDNLAADFTIENNEPLTADFTIGENNIACNFEIYASGTTWGSIAGNINNQTDLINILNDKVDLTTFNDLSETVTNNYNELSGNISDLTGTVTDNYSTLSGQISDLTGVVNDNYTSLDNRLTTAEGSVLNLTDTVSSNYTELNNKITANSNNIIVLNRTVVNNDTAINNRVDGIVESFNEDINDLSDRVTANSDNITIIQNTINTYGDIVTYNAAYFATANQGALADTALQPNDNISELTNNVGYITSASLPTVNNGTLDIQVNGTSIGTFTANQSGNTTANIVVPDSATWGNITGTLSNQTDLQAALNSKYDASNPNGYTSNVGTVTSVNNIAPVSGNVTINIPTDTADLTNGAGFITSADLPTNNVTTDTVQTITARKTFTGEKAIYFKQVATTNKLGFTLYNPSDTELGAFEYRPNTISGGALLNVNVPYSSSNYVGFRYWGTAVNVIAPKVTTAGNYFIPTHITDGTNTVTASNNGTLNISSLLPNITVDQTYDATSTNAQSGVAINGAGFLKNTADTSDSLAIGNDVSPHGGRYSVLLGHSAEGQSGTVALGYNASGTSSSIAIGYNSSASGDGSTSIGSASSATANYAIQLGYGTNSTANSLSVGFYNSYSTHYNWQLLDGTTGLIPDARLSTSIARTSQIPDVSNFVTNTSLATTLADYVTNSALTTILTDYALTTDIPTKTSDLTNDSNFATVSQIPINNNQLTNGAGYITASALSGYATENFVTSQGYITGITSSDVTTALGYTPYNATNPNGYITASALNGYATEQWVTNQIPTVNDGTLTIQKNGATIGTFTANQSTNSTINIEADTVLTDDITVSKNSDDELQAIGVIDDNTGNAITTWTGTLAEYNAITTKDPNTLYNITDDNTADAYEAYTKAQVDSMFTTVDLDNLSNVGKQEIVNCVMPSTSQIDFTITTAGQIITMPNSGYLQVIAYGSKSTNSFIGLYGNVSSMVVPFADNIDMRGFIPVSKGENVQVYFNNATNIQVYLRKSKGVI